MISLRYHATMRLIKIILKPPWRTLSVCILPAILFLLGYQLWTPGKVVRDGSHDLETNGIWLQHGWLGDDKWFKRYNKKPEKFRQTQKIIELKNLLVKHHIKDLYPHLCPCRKSGEISAVDPQQTQRFILIMDELRIIPWVGGVLGRHAFPESPAWRHGFIKSILELLHTYPAISGIHINIEPMPSGNQDFIKLLQELRRDFLRDIFAPMRPLKKAERRITMKGEPRVRKAPSLKLKGVIVGGRNSVAIINGKLVRLGESIEGYQVVRIEEKEVFLRSGNSTFKLELAKND